MAKITIILSDEEAHALRIISEKELRGFKDQARFILRDEFIRQGVLSETIYNPKPVHFQGDNHA